MASYLCLEHPLRLALTFALLLSTAPSAYHCLHLDRHGGYHIVVAISDSELSGSVGSRRGEANEYIKLVKEMLNSFGTTLWYSTNSVFSLKSVQILVPGAWSQEFGIEAKVSTTATYDGADVQISDTTDQPFAENYHPCGKPGVRILLPLWFLHAERAHAEFGSQSKGLLSLWLRYRFGIWEEHGYPLHRHTPYFYRPNDVEQQGSVTGVPWRLTSCNSSELFGVLKQVNPNSSNPCHLHDFHVLQTCRFEPDRGSNDNHVDTSLMNFQWIESIQGLCDAGTHDTRAPNRQNLYCNFRSVWEVIRSSEDFTGLNKTGSSGTVPEVEYNVVIENSKPILYILLDRAAPDFSRKDKVYRLWMNELETFVSELPSDVLVTLVSYPNMVNLTTDLSRHVGWTILNDSVRKQIFQSFNVMAIVAQPRYDYFNFRLPLSEVLSELKQKAHSPGTNVVLLVLRTEMIYFGQFVDKYLDQVPGPYEEDFAVELRQYGISLFAVETNVRRDSVHPTNVTLEYLTLASGGMYAEITNKNPAESESEREMAGMRSVLKSVVDRISISKEDQHQHKRAYQIIYKELFTNISEKSFLIPEPSACDWQIVYVYVVVAGARFETVELQLLPSNSVDGAGNVPFTERMEWFPWLKGNHVEDDDLRLSYSYRASVNLSSESYQLMLQKGSSTQKLWELRVSNKSSSLGWIKGAVTVYGLKTETDFDGCRESPTPILKAEILTSAHSSHKFGCVSMAVNEEPLAIYAKLSIENGNNGEVPVFVNSSAEGQDLPVVAAHLLHLRTGASLTVALHDDGMGADLLANDSLYSGYVYPHLRDGWRLYVTVYDTRTNTSVRVNSTVNPIGRIHSMTQADLQVVKHGTTLSTPFSATFESPNLIRVTAECVGKRFIPRVVDTQVAVVEGDIAAKFVNITFTVPVITASTEGGGGIRELEGDPDDDMSCYFMGMAYLAEDIDILINNLTHESVRVEAFLVPKACSGRTPKVPSLERENATVFGMILIDPGLLPTKSPLSIVYIKGWHWEAPPAGKVGCLIGCVLFFEIASGLVISLLVLTLFLLWKRNRVQAEKLRMLSSDEVKEFLYGAKRGGGVKVKPVGGVDEYLDLSERIQCLPYDSKYEIPNNKLHIDRTELLGSGAFGNVYKGYVLNHGGSGKILIVAVKTMKPNMDKSYFKVMLAEVKLMTLIGHGHGRQHHPNIVRLVGACTKNIRKCEVFLATEFCVNGSLSSYLLKLDGQTTSTRGLIKWAREIANGLEFLGRNKIIHGDLAARNILLDDNLIAKISDFGLSKQSVQQQYATMYEELSNKNDGEEGRGLLPWKWVAPEVLTFGKFSVNSDVWSYGITLWEIFSLGQLPYQGIQWSPDFVHKLEHLGLRLTKPTLASDLIYDIMHSCWTFEPKGRPGFNKLKAGFDKMLIDLADGEYLDLQDNGESNSRKITTAYINV